MTTEVQKRQSHPTISLILCFVAAVVLMIVCGGPAVTAVLVLAVGAVFGLMYALGEALAKDGLVPLPERQPRDREISHANTSVPSERNDYAERAA